MLANGVAVHRYGFTIRQEYLAESQAFTRILWWLITFLPFFFLTQPVGFRYHKCNLGRGARVVLGHASATGGVHMHLRIIAWLTAAVLCLVVGVGVAQEKVKGRLPQGFAKLGLSDEQKQKIYKIQAEYDAKVEALEAQIKKLREEERTQIFAVLTPQQKELYLKLRGIPEAKPSDTKPEK
jgi:hypothetical protein